MIHLTSTYDFPTAYQRVMDSKGLTSVFINSMTYNSMRVTEIKRPNLMRHVNSAAITVDVFFNLHLTLTIILRHTYIRYICINQPSLLPGKNWIPYIEYSLQDYLR